MDDEILTLKEIASYLKVNEKTIYRLIEEQSIPAFKVGHAWRFKKKDIESWIKSHTNNQKTHKN